MQLCSSQLTVIDSLLCRIQYMVISNVDMSWLDPTKKHINDDHDVGRPQIKWYYDVVSCNAIVADLIRVILWTVNI